MQIATFLNSPVQAISHIVQAKMTFTWDIRWIVWVGVHKCDSRFLWFSKFHFKEGCLVSFKYFERICYCDVNIGIAARSTILQWSIRIYGIGYWHLGSRLSSRCWSIALANIASAVPGDARWTFDLEFKLLGIQIRTTNLSQKQKLSERMFSSLLLLFVVLCLLLDAQLALRLDNVN